MNEKEMKAQKGFEQWAKRMADKKAREEAAEKQRAEELCADYLKRTGRTELKP